MRTRDLRRWFQLTSALAALLVGGAAVTARAQTPAQNPQTGCPAPRLLLPEYLL
jgi:hypothetical protein